MGKLGYTWYPQDWWTSQTFKRLKKFPLVRYAIRELFDLMYQEGKPIFMNKEYLKDDFNIELSEEEFEKLLEYITITNEGKWWLNSVKKRICKAEAARENGKKGGRPKITQEPRKITQNNPPLEREREREEEEFNNNNLDTIEFLKSKYLKNEKLKKAVLSIKKNKLKNEQEIIKRLEEFNDELQSKSILKKKWLDYSSHFLNWHRKTVDKNQKSGPNIPIG